MAKTYKLVPKNGKGAIWYMDAKELFVGNYVKAHIFEFGGFETVVDIRNYDVIKH